MKFRISKEAFLDGLQKVQHVVSSRTTLPILSNVLLVAKDGRIDTHATAVAEGRREVWLRITQTLNLSDETLQRFKEQEND